LLNRSSTSCMGVGVGGGSCCRRYHQFSASVQQPCLLLSAHSPVNNTLYGHDNKLKRRGFVSSTTPINNAASASSSASSLMTQLKELRTLSGAPMVDCKKALTEMNGDIDKSLDWLRKHGTAKVSKKHSNRETTEGLVACAVSDDGKSASLIKVSSETDFAAKSETFIKLASHVAFATLNSKNTCSVTQDVLGFEYNSKSVQTVLDEAIVAIRENVGVSTAIKMETNNDNDNEDALLLAAYVHGKVGSDDDLNNQTQNNAGLAAAVVDISGKGVVSNPKLAKEVGKKLAMHIVAAKPTYLNLSNIPTELVEKEKELLKSQIVDSKKPPEVIERIINGRMKKFYSDICLVEQEHFVEEGNQKVSKVLADHGLAVSSFQLLSI